MLQNLELLSAIEQELQKIHDLLPFIEQAILTYCFFIELGIQESLYLLSSIEIGLQQNLYLLPSTEEPECLRLRRACSKPWTYFPQLNMAYR